MSRHNLKHILISGGSREEYFNIFVTGRSISLYHYHFHQHLWRIEVSKLNISKVSAGYDQVVQCMTSSLTKVVTSIFCKILEKFHRLPLWSLSVLLIHPIMRSKKLTVQCDDELTRLNFETDCWSSCSCWSFPLQAVVKASISILRWFTSEATGMKSIKMKLYNADVITLRLVMLIC